ncbi:MAG: pilus assembly protein TadG-related protein [Pseudomonadota bacterium]
MINISKKFVKNKLGTVATTVGIMAVPLMVVSGIAIDYSILSQVQSRLQNSADAAALAGAKELGLTNISEEAMKTTTRNYVIDNLLLAANVNTSKSTLKVNPTIPIDRTSLTVDIEYYWTPFLLHLLNKKALPVRVSATASLAGTGTICMIGLDEKKGKTIHLTKKASLEASGCGVYANSSSKEAIRVEDNASLSAGVTCSAGGIKGAKKASFDPEPLTDCPRVSDPLASRITPSVGSCDFTDFEVKTGTHTLEPGTYCQGLKVKGTAKVWLKPGVYVINGDKLEVTDNAVFEGENVGFFLSGNKAKLVFKKQTTINLTAPETGVMAGLLMFEDRTASKIEKHEITSDNARLLLGTIYLPNGTLRIDSEGPIADKAAYTAIIARAIELDEGPTLFLNSDYEATDVPVPEGLIGNKVRLAR